MFFHVGDLPFWHFDDLAHSESWFLPSFGNVSDSMTALLQVAVQL
jgi:hypothetical protein